MKPKAQKAIICLAAGQEQCLVMRKARGMGFKVIAVDRNPCAVGFSLADEKIVLSTYEAGPIISRIRNLKKYKIKGVVNRSSGPPVVTAAKISAAFGLPGLCPGVAKDIVYKSRLNKVCARKGISVSVCQAVRSLSELELGRVKFPLIVKPSLSLVGKSGVSIANDTRQLKQAFQKSKKSSFDGLVNIEEYVDGQDFCLMAMVYNGRLFPVVLLDELNMVNPQRKIYGAGFVIPSIFTGTVRENKILSLAADIIKKLKLTTTVFLMSCRCTSEGKPRLIEIHLDLGGDLILDRLLPSSTDFDFIKYAISILTDNPVALPQISFSPTAILFGSGINYFRGRFFKIIKQKDSNSLKGVLTKLGFYNSASFS